VRVGEQNLYAQARNWLETEAPREHEFSIQLRAMDADKSGTGVGLPVLVALVGGLLERHTRGGTIIVGPSTLVGPSR
jgi:ATP-dependent Lon protease